MTEEPVPGAGALAREREFLARALTDPSWLLAAIDPGADRAAFVRLSEDGYRRAPFLDERAIEVGAAPVLTRLSAVVDAAREAEDTSPAHVIFHPGHVGSTLVSRLLGECAGVLALREPLPLLSLAALWREQRHSPGPHYRHLEHAVLRFLGRRFPGTRAVVVKATSECCGLLNRVLEHHPLRRVLWWTVDLETFLAGMLRNRARREETAQFLPGRLQDLRRRLGEDLPGTDGLDDARATALNWLSLMAHRLDVAPDDQFRVEDVHFHDFLAAPARVLARVAEHLGIGADDAEARRVVGSGWMGRYAKSPDARFDAAERERQLARSRESHSEEIRRGLAFAESLCSEHAGLAPLATRLRRGG